MFTVGILVGKGLTQAKYEGGIIPVERHLSAKPAEKHEPAPVENSGAHSGNSVSLPEQTEALETHASESSTGEVAKAVPATVEEAPLKLIPQKPKEATSPSSLLEPKLGADTDSILKNPKLQALVEADPKAKRKINALGMPESAAQGKFSVQVGSYPSEKEAQERVESLKKLGFPHASFSAKTLGESSEVWYRVWLGYFPDYDSANASGLALKDRGEVRQYLVRKVDSSGRTD
jgi:cell division protein FtsN